MTGLKWSVVKQNKFEKQIFVENNFRPTITKVQSIQFYTKYKIKFKTNSVYKMAKITSKHLFWFIIKIRLFKKKKKNYKIYLFVELIFVLQLVIGDLY